MSKHILVLDIHH